MNDMPYRAPALIRDNAFTRLCHSCNMTVPANEGQAFLLWSDLKQKNVWHAAHEDCMTSILAGLPPVPATVGSIAAKAVNAPTMDDVPESLRLPDTEDMEAMLAALSATMTAAIVTDVAEAWTAKVPAMVESLLATARPVAIAIGEASPVLLDKTHLAFDDVLDMVVADTSPMLVGPAGSGKTTLAGQIAKAMSLPFYFASRVSSEHKLNGYYHPHNGQLIRTPFREAWEHGGVFLFDEVDASEPDALTAFNAALAGSLADFPDGIVARHKDFYCIAAANTFGRGGDRQYVGRNQLDAATLDRFQTYEVNYDEDLERYAANNDEWTTYVQSVRKAIDEEKIRHVVSPRASIAGAKLIARGWSHAKAAEACVWKGLDAAQRTRIEGRMNGRNW